MELTLQSRKRMQKKLFFILFLWPIAVISQHSASHTTFKAAAHEFEQGVLNEKRYYTNFNEEYFTNSFKAYPQSGILYLEALKKCSESEKIYASYYAMKSFYAEAEVYSAMESGKRIYDLYINLFDEFISDSNFKLYKQNPSFTIDKKSYDSIWYQTVDIIYKNSLAINRELSIIKYGQLLLPLIPKNSERLLEIQYHIIKSSANIGESVVLIQFCKQWLNNKKRNNNQNSEIIKFVEEGIKNHPESFNEEQVSELNACIKKLS